MPIEKPFQKLVFRVLPGFSKNSKTIKALGLRPQDFISFLVFAGNPGKTLALVFEILHLILIEVQVETKHWSGRISEK